MWFTKLPHYKFQCPLLNKKNHKESKKGNYGSFNRNTKVHTETIPEKDLMISLLDKDFKTTVLRMLRPKEMCWEN